MRGRFDFTVKMDIVKAVVSYFRLDSTILPMSHIENGYEPVGSGLDQNPLVSTRQLFVKASNLEAFFHSRLTLKEV